MSTYDSILDIGIEKGIEKGIEQGIDLGIEKGIDLGIEKGIERGASEKEVKVIKNILTEFPEWEDEKIANLATSTIEVVQTIRAEIEDSENKAKS